MYGSNISVKSVRNEAKCLASFDGVTKNVWAQYGKASEHVSFWTLSDALFRSFARLNLLLGSVASSNVALMKAL